LSADAPAKLTGSSALMGTRMTYEEYLDEVTTLLTETYSLSDAAAIKMVMDAQAAEFFSKHDDEPSMCTLQRAVQDAKNLFTAKQKKVRRN
jgi:hypothetical protein